MKSTYKPFVAIAETHVQRLQFALDKLKNIMPIGHDQIQSMSDLEFMYFEVLTNRFSKLQDYLGAKIFDICLEAHKETFLGMSMIDKLNKLEKIGIIDSADFWDELRELRNHLTHEYPNHPELTAKYLNYTYRLAPRLIQLTAIIIKSLDQGSNNI